MAVTVISGPNKLENETLVGKKVSEVWSIVQQAMNVAASATATVNGDPVEPDHVLEDGDELKFVQPAGRKSLYAASHKFPASGRRTAAPAPVRELGNSSRGHPRQNQPSPTGMRAPVRKFGNSSGVIIPKPILIQIGVEVGDDLDLSLDDNRIILAPLKRHPRAGWAKAAKRIAEAGDDVLVWPEFNNAGDPELKW